VIRPKDIGRKNALRPPNTFQPIFLSNIAWWLPNDLAQNWLEKCMATIRHFFYQYPCQVLPSGY